MKNGLEELNKFRKYLIKHCKNLNTGKSPVFITISSIAGISIVIVSALLAPNSIIGRIGIVLGLVTAAVNAVQLIYKKYI